jgi:hypothetical protein
VSYKKQELVILGEHLSSPRFFWGFVLLILLIYVLFYYVSVRSEFRIVMPITISVLFYYVSVCSELRIVMSVTISMLFYYVSVRSEFVL